MARKKKETAGEPPLLLHTMAQTAEAQKVSQQLSELPDLKQHPEAPKITGYLLIKPLGRGAYAQVWEALQLRTRKFVAIKVFTKKTGVHWFYLQREADRLVRLDKHPHIVSLLDADLAGESPYYVMDLAQEGSLEGLMDGAEGGVEVEKAVGWMEEVAQALHYVHSKRMVHCDLKPANVLLDDEGHVRVADFGNSRVLSESGGTLGTLFYMAPEQAVTPTVEGPLQPDPRWDIYALGCTMYSLLSDKVPHSEIGDKLEMAPGVEERLRLYRDAIQTQPVPDLLALTKGRVDKDLSAIVAKCMHPDPALRYSTVDQILADLKARREDRPVSPLSHDTGYWISKFVKRYRASVAIAAASLAALSTALYFLSNRQTAQIQDTALNYVLRGREFLDKGDEASAVAYFAASNKMAPSILARGNAYLHMPPVPGAFFAHDGSIVAVSYSPNGNILLTAGGTTGAKLWNGSTGRALSRPLAPGGTLTAAAFNREGSRLVLGDSNGEARVFDVATQKAVGRPLRHNKAITSAVFSDDGRRVLTAGEDDKAREWNASTGQALSVVMEHDRPILSAVFNPAGDRVLSMDKDGSVQLWDANNGDSLGGSIKTDLKGAPSWYRPSLAFNPNGRGFLVTGWDGTVKFYDKRGKRAGRVLFLEGVGARAVYSPDGNYILASVIYGGSVGLARVFHARTRSPLKFSLKTEGKIGVLAFSPDGREVLTAGTDHVIRVWDAQTGKPLGHDFWQSDMVTAAAFDPSGKTLAAGCKDGLACLWPLSSGAGDDDMAALEWGAQKASLKKRQDHALFSPDLKKAITYGGISACLWDASTGKALGEPFYTGGTILRAVFNPDGSKLLTCDSDGEARLWDLGKRDYKSLSHDKAVRGGAFDSDGKRVLTGGEDKTLRLWESASGREWGKPVPTGFPVSKALLSPDGERMAALGTRGELKLYPVQQTGAKALLKVEKGAQSPLFSPDGRLLAYVLGKTASLAEAKTGIIIRNLNHGVGLTSVLWSPDGTKLASLGTEGTIRLWDAATGLSIGNALKHEGPVLDWAFSPHGEALLAAYQDGGWEFWDTKTGEAIGEEVSGGLSAKAVGFTPDGRSVRLLGKDGRMAEMAVDWMDPRTDPDQLLLESQVTGRAWVDGQGSLQTVSADQWVRLWAKFRKEK